MANIFRIKIRSLFPSLIITSICLLVRSFIRAQSSFLLTYNLVSMAGGKNVDRKIYKRGWGTLGEMEQYHRQLLIPVAIEPDSMAPLVLVKKNNVNNNESSDNVSDDRVVDECNSLKRIAQTPETAGKQRLAETCIAGGGWI